MIDNSKKSKLCACGCGQTITWKAHHKYQGFPNFLWGHNGNKNATPIETRICSVCFNEFKARACSTQKICSHECSAKNARKFRTPMTEERRRKISEGISKLYLAGTFNPFWFYKSGWYYLKNKQVKLFYRSSYEKKAYQILDACLDVKEVRSESVMIPYYDVEGNLHNYLPDVKVTTVSGQEILIEVKSNDFLNTITNQIKFKAAEKYAEENNMIFLVWTEDILFNNNGSTTTSLQAIVEATVATSNEVMI